MITATREIANANRTIGLSDLYKDDGTPYYRPYLYFEDATSGSTWDNEEYVLKFLKKLSKGKKKRIEELREHCEVNKLDFEKTKKELIGIYEESVKLNFWGIDNKEQINLNK